jgi:NAD kinase
MHSGNEQKIDKAITLHGNAFIHHCANHVIRVYPSLWRVDSGNFGPLVSFCFSFKKYQIAQKFAPTF